MGLGSSWGQKLGLCRERGRGPESALGDGVWGRRAFGGRGLGAWYKTRTESPKGTISVWGEAEAEGVPLRWFIQRQGVAMETQTLRGSSLPHITHASCSLLPAE